MTVIGITGPTGAGKTTVLKEIEALGGAVIDCDAVYHEMLESDRALQESLERAMMRATRASAGASTATVVVHRSARPLSSRAKASMAVRPMPRDLFSLTICRVR